MLEYMIHANAAPDPKFEFTGAQARGSNPRNGVEREAMTRVGASSPWTTARPNATRCCATSPWEDGVYEGIVRTKHALHGGQRIESRVHANIIRTRMRRSRCETCTHGLEPCRVAIRSEVWSVLAASRRRRGGARSSRAQRDSSYTRSQGYDGKSFGVSFKAPASKVWGELQTLMKSEHDVRTALGATAARNETRK